jgi:hypothetical protein
VYVFVFRKSLLVVAPIWNQSVLLFINGQKLSLLMPIVDLAVYRIKCFVKDPVFQYVSVICG